MNFIAELVLLIPVLLLSLSMHEFAHGKMADFLGDPTPKATGRLTLNPLAHLSFLGTLVLLLTRRFGWAKPVQINPKYFKDRKKGMMLVGLAGPLANISLAITFAIMYNYLSFLFTFFNPRIIAYFFQIAIAVNLGLAIFNLIPIPPLDGSKILEGILPKSMDHILYNLKAYGPFFLLLFLFMGWLDFIINPIFGVLFNLILQI
ncbi:Zn-dependent protease [Halobacteroides halobius DSM 5150]|uniref:Zn-dependent protease n=1 Tax=Halobacteroides halobius (strain ATCC 35273 / DSM 5150 / MD-1) TaxID=748449 RepID=L0K7P9_HALHC|nr:site-2 protease family protein [Halobacteroides halobius]AGB40580.1 Zn-dependent protease [Halobacteroides halobius DSM 5150]